MFFRTMKESWSAWLLMIMGVMVIGVTVIQKNSQPPSNASLSSMAGSPIVSHQSDPISSPALVTSPQQGKEGPFVIQAYSFRDKARADAIVGKMKAQGYSSYVLMSDLGERGIWYRVRVGTFTTSQEAQEALEKLKKDSHHGFITKHVAAN